MFAELSLSDYVLAVTVPSCVSTAILALVVSNFLQPAECLIAQARLRVVSGYSLLDLELRKCMARLAAFFPSQAGKRGHQIVSKYDKDVFKNASRLAQHTHFHV